VAWITIHRLDAQTLPALVADHLRPRLRELEARADTLRTDQSKAAQDEYATVADQRDELAELIATLQQCAEQGPPPPAAKVPARAVDAVYAPDLDDGVMINSAALWPLLEPQWKKPREWWTELAQAKGRKDYDWAHLAARYWPARVDQKCRKDPSLAVAHGCFWAYHPARAYKWELRLQDEIGPDFRIHESAGPRLSGEPDAGSDAGGLKATAVRRGDHYVLDGTKSWVTSGGHAGLYLVMASTDPAARTRGISAFLVPATAPGLTATKPEDKMGLRSSATTQLVLEGVRVPVADRLGPEGIGFKVAMNALDGGRVGVSAQACGIATAAFELLLDVARREGVAGREALLADSAAELEAGWLMCLRAARMKDAGVRFSKEAAMTKLYCSEMAGRVCERALQAHGTAGELAAAERLLRDTRINRIYEGT
ncbi:MAG: acyl-CoA dehydrogenase family protein, partial [Myxococcales bacterium]|nr:acyl-CoA dehydrogenase family protein [Myxococcales bacterium]